MTFVRRHELDKRVSKLTDQNQDLETDVNHMKDTLRLHHEFKSRDNASVRGMIRNEIGGPVWQHGAQGRLHTYTSVKDLEREKGSSATKGNSQRGKQTNAKLKEKLSNHKSSTNVAWTNKKSGSLGPSVHKNDHGPRASVGSTGANKKKPSSTSGQKVNGSRQRIHSSSDSDEQTVEESKIENSSGLRKSLNETYTKDVFSALPSGFKIPVIGDDELLTPSHVEDHIKNPDKTDKKRALVLKKMLKKLDVDGKIAEYRTSETDSDSLSTPRTPSGAQVSVPAPKPVRFCDPDVMAWLLNLGLKDTEKYARIFAEHDIYMETLGSLTEIHLQMMGITAPGTLLRLSYALDDLRKPAPKVSVRTGSVHESSALATKVKSEKQPAQGISKNYKHDSLKDDEVKIPKTHQRTKPVYSKDKYQTPNLNPKSSLSSSNQTQSSKSKPSAIESSKNPWVSSAVPSKNPGAIVSKDSSSAPNGRKGTAKARPVSAVVRGSAKPSVRNPARPVSASIARPDPIVTGKPPAARKESERTPQTSSTKTVTVPSSTTERKATLSDMITVRSIAPSKPEADPDFESCLQVEKANQAGVSSSAEDRLTQVEQQIQALEQELTSPAAMVIIDNLRLQLKEIQKEIITKKTQDEKIEDSVDLGVKRLSRSCLPLKKQNTDNNSSPRPSGAAVPDAGYHEHDRPGPEQDINEVLNSLPSVKVKTTGPGVASMSMSKTELLKEVRKQKDMHRKHIRHLESELSRLKHKDPVRNCEISEGEIDFDEEDMIGEGGFSQVFHGNYQGSEVAVKRLKVPLSSQDKNYFAAEVSLLRELRHPRVVLLLGVCTTSQLPLMVLEYLAEGSLYHYLHNQAKPSLDHAAYYQIAKDVALGMNYLHRHNPVVLHLDLKSMNVLLNAYLRAKIADFGFSKLRHDADQVAKKQSSQKGQNQGQVKGTPAWMAPELLDSGDVSTKSDVYSYSIIMWEMLTRRHPYAGCSVFQVIDRTRTNKRLEIPVHCPKGLKDVISRCWNQNPARRPSFKDILSQLDKLQLPGDWRSLFAKAGIPKAALDHVDSTRTLIDLVTLTLDDLPKRPDDVPVLNLHDSDDENKKLENPYLEIEFSDSEDGDDEEDWEDLTEEEASSSSNVSSKKSNKFLQNRGPMPDNMPRLELDLSGEQKQIRTAMTFRKNSGRNDIVYEEDSDDVQERLEGLSLSAKSTSKENSMKPPQYLPPPPPPPVPAHGQKFSVGQPTKKPQNVRESFLQNLQSALNNRPDLKESSVSEHAIQPQGQRVKGSLSDLRSSQLMSQKGKLKPIEKPHPCQLQTLSEVPKDAMKNLFQILKKAVESRRLQIGQPDSLENSLTLAGWSLNDEQ